MLEKMQGEAKVVMSMPLVAIKAGKDLNKKHKKAVEEEKEQETKDINEKRDNKTSTKEKAEEKID